MALTRTVTTIGSLAILACGQDPVLAPVLETPDIEWEGEWLRFGRSPVLAQECAGVAPYMDRYVGALVDIFEIESDVVVDFYYVDEIANPCGAIGCVKEQTAFSVVPVQEHELVHAVRSFEGFSHRFLEEGAAEYWGDDSKVFEFRENTGGSLVAAAQAASLDGLETQAYGVAGRFHSFLARDGPENANRLLRTTQSRMDIGELQEQLENVTGLDLQAWESAFAAYPECDQAEFRNASAACRSVPLVPRCRDGAAVPIEVYVGCDDELSLGPRDGEIWSYRAVDIQETGTYVFGIVPDFDMLGGSVELKQCEGGCGSTLEFEEVPTSAAPGRAFDAEAGRYLLRFTLPEGNSAEFTVYIDGDCQE